jgi:hypothetical protein
MPIYSPAVTTRPTSIGKPSGSAPAAAWLRSSIGQRIAAAPPWLVLAIAWGILVLYAFPGQMTQDSWDHLTEARKGVFTDGHPPVIDLLFRWADYVIAGPFLMLVLQSVPLLIGLYLIFRQTFAARRAAWLTLGLYIFPPVMMPMAVIWKDSLMAGFLALGLGALLGERRRSVRLLGLGAMFVASAVRYNAFAATLPLIVLGFTWRPASSSLKRYAIAAATWLAITFAAFGANKLLTDKPMYIWHSSLAVYDIVGTLTYVDGEYPDAELEQLLAGTDLLVHHDIHKTMRALYTPKDFLPIVNDAKLALWALPINGIEPAPAGVRDAVARAWWEVITSHAGAYVRHRLAVTGAVLSFGSARVAGAVTKRDAFRWPAYVHEMGQGTGWSKLQGKWTRAMTWIWRNTPIFVPWIYALVSLVLIPLAWRHRDVLALLFSGLVFESTLVLLAPSPDYRYSHWMVVTACVAIVVLTARRSRVARAPAPGPAPLERAT